MSSEYSRKLKSPEWQKKRLEVLDRDKFTCQLCNDTATELHVHHKMYVFGNDPWDYPLDNLVTYCKYCHMVVEFFKGNQYKPVISIKTFKDTVYITCILHNPILNKYGISICMVNSNEEIVSYCELSEDAIGNINNLLQLAKLMSDGKNT